MDAVLLSKAIAQAERLQQKLRDGCRAYNKALEHNVCPECTGALRPQRLGWATRIRTLDLRPYYRCTECMSIFTAIRWESCSHMTVHHRGEPQPSPSQRLTVEGSLPQSAIVEALTSEVHLLQATNGALCEELKKFRAITPYDQPLEIPTHWVGHDETRN